MDLSGGKTKSALTIAAAGVLALALTACSGSSSTNSSGSGSSSSGSSSGSSGSGSSGSGSSGSSSGSSSTGDSKANTAEGKTFTMAIASDPGDLDPHLTSLSAAYQVDAFMYDTLVAVDPSGKEVAGLASKWTGTSTSATYTLRKGITCSDGTALTVDDVAANINFVGNPKNASSRLGLFVPPGAKATADKAAGTVSVTSASPDAFLVHNVGSLAIVCAKGMQNRAILKHGGSGTGMFVLTEAVADDHYTFTRRKEYAWGPGNWQTGQAGLPDKVVLKVVQNEATAANLLLSGQVNAAGITGPDKARVAAKNLFKREVLAPVGEMWFNQKKGEPGADLAVRKALTQALDLTKVGKVITSGEGKASIGMVAPGMGPCHANTVAGNIPSYDVAAAKSTLDAAGWTVGADGIRQKAGKKLSMSFHFPTGAGSGMQAGAELLRDSWQSVGAEVKLKGDTAAEIGQAIIAGQGSWEAAFLPLGVTLPSQIVPFVSGTTPPTGTNFAFINNSGYNEHVKKAAASPGAAGCAEWAAAEKAIFEQLDVVLFVDSSSPVFADGATFEFSAGTLDPTTIRMLS